MTSPDDSQSSRFFPKWDIGSYVRLFAQSQEVQQTFYDIHEWREQGRDAADAGKYEEEVLGDTLDIKASHFHSLLTFLALAGQEGALYAYEFLRPAVEQDSTRFGKAWDHLRYAAMHMDDANTILLDAFYDDLYRNGPSSERIPMEEERTLKVPRMFVDIQLLRYVAPHLCTQSLPG